MSLINSYVEKVTSKTYRCIKNHNHFVIVDVSATVVAFFNGRRFPFVARRHYGKQIAINLLECLQDPKFPFIKWYEGCCLYYVQSDKGSQESTALRLFLYSRTLTPKQKIQKRFFHAVWISNNVLVGFACFLVNLVFRSNILPNISFSIFAIVAIQPDWRKLYNHHHHHHHHHHLFAIIKYVA